MRLAPQVLAQHEYAAAHEGPYLLQGLSWLSPSPRPLSAMHGLPKSQTKFAQGLRYGTEIECKHILLYRDISNPFSICVYNLLGNKPPHKLVGGNSTHFICSQFSGAAGGAELGCPPGLVSPGAAHRLQAWLSWPEEHRAAFLACLLVRGDRVGDQVLARAPSRAGGRRPKERVQGHKAS